MRELSPMSEPMSEDQARELDDGTLGAISAEDGRYVLRAADGKVGIGRSPLQAIEDLEGA